MAENVVGAVELDNNLRAMARLVDGPKVMDALMQGGFVIERAAKENVQEQGLIDTGKLRASIRTQPAAGEKAVLVGTNVVYAAIHEFGGVLQPTVTAKMRGWAWHMYKQTGDGKYKGMALTKKGKLNIHLPARPYLRPAADENKVQVLQAVGAVLKTAIEGLGL